MFNNNYIIVTEAQLISLFRAIGNATEWIATISQGTKIGTAKKYMAEADRQVSRMSEDELHSLIQQFKSGTYETMRELPEIVPSAFFYNIED